MAEAKKKQGLFARIGKWFREMRSELKKVVWPTGKQVFNNTLIVIVVSVIVGIIVGLLDMAFSTGVLRFLGLFPLH